MNKFKRHLAILACVAIAGAALSVPAAAKPDGERGRGPGKTRPAATKMRFKLDSHQWDVGAEVTGSVTLLTRDGKKWAPLAGAPLSIVIDGSDCIVIDGGSCAAQVDDCIVADGGDCIVEDGGECASVVTDAEGRAAVACGPAAAGGYVMRVRYAGDETHKRSKRAQGYNVGAAEDEEEEDDLVPLPDPSPTI